MVPPTVVDLFCGCGGASWGFYMAGFKPIYALDSWGVACQSYKANMRKAEVVCRDALTVDPSRSLTPLFYRRCPACGCDGLVDHGAGHRECLICGFDSARDEVRTPGEWLRDAAAQVNAEARGLHRRTQP